jgi:two-component system response regulator DegU
MDGGELGSMDGDLQLATGPSAPAPAGDGGPAPITILIADDHPLFREGLRRALDLAAGLVVVGEAADGEACLAAAERIRPAVVLVDLSMPGPGGREVVRRLKEIHPNGKVVVLTIHDGEQDLLDAVRAGADGYILKDVEPSELVRAIRACWRGERYLQQGLGGKLMQGLERIATAMTGGGPQSLLSEREWAVLQLLAEGCSNRDIGARLFISEKTVKNHASSLFRKLGARDRTQAVVEAVKRGWIRLS